MSKPFKAQYTFQTILHNGMWTHYQVSDTVDEKPNSVAIPERPTLLNIDMNKVARLQAEREELQAWVEESAKIFRNRNK